MSLEASVSKTDRNPGAKTGIPRGNRSEWWEQFIFKEWGMSSVSLSAQNLLAQHFSSSIHFNQDGQAPPTNWTVVLFTFIYIFLISRWNLNLWNAPLICCKVAKRFYSFITKSENRQLYLPAMRESRGQMNQDNPFIDVSIQGATTTAQVSSSPVERPHISALHRGAPSIAVMALWELLSW